MHRRQINARLDAPLSPLPPLPTPFLTAADEGVAVLRPGLLTANEQAKLKAQYEGSQPYPHCVIQDFANPDLLRKV